MKLYNFKRLIEKYSVTFTLKQMQKGGFVDGKWEQGEAQATQMRGAIVPIRDRKIYGSGGTYTEQDRELYLFKPLEGALSDFRVTYKGNTYGVEDGRNFEDYADVMVYTLKWISKSKAVTEDA